MASQPSVSSASERSAISQSTTIPVVSPPLSLKPPCQPFSNSAPTVPLVFFLHPGYKDNHNILLTLPAFDSGGIHHATAHIACAILANGRWDGFLSLSRDGPRLSANPDDVLPHGRYYFCIEGEEQYPVVPTFDEFLCPASLPPSYSSAPILPTSADDAIRRDVTCRITASALPNETAHIIPAAQSDWWQQNCMFLYTANPGRGQDTRCADNTILLRRDLHKMWDDHRFAVVPKAGKWVVHALWNFASAEIQERYHNLELQPLAGVSPYFFLCRFAMAVFSKSPFLGQRVPRKLVIVDNEGSAGSQVRNMAADEYQRRFFKTGNRTDSGSRSPTKRQRSVQEEMVDDGYTTEESEDASGTGCQQEEEEEEERGRPRKRKFSPELDDAVLDEYLNGGDAVVLDTHEGQSLHRKRQRSLAGLARLRTPPKSTSPAG